MTHPASGRLRRLVRSTLAAALCVAVSLPVAGAFAAPAAAAEEVDTPEFSALVFSKTAGFRHDSIPAGIAAITQLGADNNFTVDATEDSTAFTDANLANYDVVVWLSTTGDVLDADQQAAFERYITGGGGYAGIHAAADTEYDWPFYGELVGAYFQSHPANQNVTVKTTDRVHPSTSHLPALSTRFDELYNYQTNPRDTVHVLQELDEKTYTGGSMGTADHPITWCQDYEGGRSWYTGMGHTQASYAEAPFLTELLGGIRSAAGVVDADCTATQSANFDKVTLNDGTQNPMDVAPAADGRTFYLERDGRLQIVQPSGGTTTAGSLDVTLGAEFGLVGIELAPDFATSNHLYLFWSPAGSDSDRLSRFTMNGDTLDLASEEVVLEVPVQRAECCHVGGALQFDTQGNLYVATGDNTNPFASDGYTPIDETPGRSSWDAQRTAGNTNDLRGKILRIHPEADGTYSIPDGNLFPVGTEKTLPEIYAMGFRNPFKIGLDPRTDTVLVANYGPDAGSTNPNRGPDGRVEWDAVSEPGNYGWPYCMDENTAYNDFNFATRVAGPKFDCANPINNSPNNTGLTQLPPAISADVWYGYGTNPEFPEIGGGGAPMAGSVYSYDADSSSERKWPQYWDGKAIFGEWNQGKLYSFDLDATTTAVTDIDRILPALSFLRPHAMEWGADGALYVIDWGSGFGGNNADSGLYRIDYISGNRAPIASLTADKTSGPVPLTVAFDSAGSRDPDDTPVTLAWDFDGDGTTDSTEVAPTFTYTEAGNFTAQLTVTDADGRMATATQAITAGNTAPTITVAAPPNGGFFDFGDQVAYTVTVTDPEDGTIDCQDVIVQPALGHAEHSHPYSQYRGCTGTVPVPGDDGHVGADIFGVITVTYTDKGGPGVAPLTTQEVLVLQPKRKEAEYFSATGRLDGSTSTGTAGVQLETTADTAGGFQNVGFIEPDDWFAFDPTNLTGIDSISVRAASDPGGSFEIRTGSPTGPAVGGATIAPTGGWQVYTDVVVDVPDTVSLESGPLYIVNTAGGFNVNWVDFQGKGITSNARPVVGVTATPTSGISPLTVKFATTATDAEGDTPLTYAWTFGDGGTSTEEDPTHVYENAGTFAAKVTVTDAKGAASSKTVQIKVTAPTTACLTGRSDDFLGTSLDRDRWTTIVRENQDFRVVDGALIIPTTTTDIYGAGAGTTPNIILQDLPDGAFTATAKLTLEARTQYQQAGLVIYGDDENYAKMVLQGRAPTDAPSADSRIFQFVREEAGAPNEVAESNTAALGAAFPDTVWVRFTSDGSTLRASYSADGVTFTDMPQTKALAGITDPKIGLLSLSGSGVRPVADAEFDWFQITPDDSAGSAGPDDEFDGASLDPCRWTVVRPDPAGLRVVGGNLEIDTSTADIYTTPNTAVTNVVLQPQPAGDWTVETKVDGTDFTQQYQQGGLILHATDDDYVKIDLVADNTAGSAVTRRLELRSEIGGAIQEPQPGLNPAPGSVYWLRLAQTGNEFTGSWSADGTTWTELGTVANAPAAADGRVGLFALGAAQQAPSTAVFDFFRVGGDGPGGDTTAPTVTAATDPAEPTGEAGWFTGPVSVTLTATDDQPGVVYREVRIDGGDWREYTDAVVLDGDGEHTVDYRASDTAGNVSAVGTLAVNVDGTDPVVVTTVLGDYAGTVAALNGSDIAGSATMEAGADSTTATISLTGLTPGAGYDSHLHVGTCGSPGLHYLDDPAGPGAPPNELWPTTAGTSPAPGAPRMVADAEGTATGTATVPWAPRTGARALMLHAANGGQIACATLELASPATVVLDATDATSGIDTVEYRVDGGAWTAYTVPVAVEEPGEHTLDYRAADVAGNTSQGSVAVTVPEEGDTTAPTVTTAIDPATPDGQAGWYVGPVSVSATAADDQPGEITLEYRIGDGEWAPYTGPVAVDEGEVVVGFRATDLAGNVSEVATVAVDRDATAPITTAAFAGANAAGWSKGAVPVTLSATDAVSGVASTEYRVDGGPWTALTAATGAAVSVTGDGTHTVEFRSTDTAGNVEETKAATVKIDGTKPTLLVSGIANGQIYGDAQDLRLSWSGTDATSGIRTVVGRLDGAVLQNNRLIALHELPLGLHELVVTARDNADNVTSQRVTFFVNTSFEDMANLIDRFRATGRMTTAQAKALQGQLGKARTQEARRRYDRAVVELRTFITLVGTQSVEQAVRDVLVRDADAMIARLGGTPTTGKGGPSKGGAARLPGDPDRRKV